MSAGEAIALALGGLGVGGLLAGLIQSRLALRTLRRRVVAASTQLEQTQEAFSRFAPRRVVEDVLREGVAHSAERRVVTVLFADLCGFTQMSSTLEPDVVVGILNRYFAGASQAITENRGHVSKFIGDGILALFGAIEHNPWQAQDAVRAGLRMLEEVKALSEAQQREGLPALSVSIGIHCGEVIAGVVGSRHLVEFTVLGHHVNLAARVEGLTRKLGAPLLITAPIRDQLGELFLLEQLPAEAVKGIEEPVVTWAVKGLRPG